jgi:glycosyltransferase involved in cell wall biosynthesis
MPELGYVFFGREAAMSATSLTVVIVTSNRLKLFERCLSSVLKSLSVSSISDFQIRVILNQADASTQKFVFQLNHPQIQKYETQEKLFPGAARNFGLRDIKANWLYFIDDDAFVEESFFKEAATFMTKEDVAFFGGPNISPANDSFFSKVTQAALENPLICLGPSKRYSTLKNIVEPASETSMILCNFFLRSSCLPKGDCLFDPDLVGGEENVLIEKLKSRENHGLFVSNLFVWHQRREDVSGLCYQMMTYGKGRGLMAKDYGFYSVYHLAPLILLIFPLGLYFKHLPEILIFYFIYGAGAVGLRFFKKPHAAVLASLFAIPLIHIFYAMGITSVYLSPSLQSKKGREKSYEKTIF